MFTTNFIIECGCCKMYCSHHHGLSLMLLVFVIIVLSNITAAADQSINSRHNHHRRSIDSNNHHYTRGIFIDNDVNTSIADIYCYANGIYVYVQRQLLTASSRVSLLDPTCTPSSVVSNASHFIIASRYNGCGTTVNTIHPSSFVNALMIINEDTMWSNDTRGRIDHSDDNANRSTLVHRFECVPPSSPLSSDEVDTTSSSKQQVDISVRITDAALPFDDSDQSPRKMYKGRRYLVTLEPLSDQLDVDLHAHANFCYLSEHSLPEKKRFQHVLLKGGCPFDDLTVQVLHGVADDERSMKFSFQLTTTRYFPDEFLYMFLHCDVVMCSTRAGGRRSEGFIQCPSADYCTTSNDEQSDTAAEPLINQQVVHILSGMLRPLIPEKSNTPVCDCSLHVRAPAASNPTSIPDAYRQQPPAPVRSLSYATVVIIACISFAVGALLVTCLWYIHTITNPANVLAKRRNDSVDSRSSSLDSHTHLANAPLTVVVGRHQHRHHSPIASLCTR